VYDVTPHDDKANSLVGEHVLIDTKGSLIYSPNRLIAAVGLEDMIVIDAGDALLICPRTRSQEVKQIVEELKARGMDGYLR
jgi:mannose-1-phosphate guanylyltransferase